MSQREFIKKYGPGPSGAGPAGFVKGLPAEAPCCESCGGALEYDRTLEKLCCLCGDNRVRVIDGRLPRD